MACLIPEVEHWLGPEIAQWVHHEGLIQQDYLELNIKDKFNISNYEIFL